MNPLSTVQQAVIGLLAVVASLSTGVLFFQNLSLESRLDKCTRERADLSAGLRVQNERITEMGADTKLIKQAVTAAQIAATASARGHADDIAQMRKALANSGAGCAGAMPHVRKVLRP